MVSNIAQAFAVIIVGIILMIPMQEIVAAAGITGTAGTMASFLTVFFGLMVLMRAFKMTGGKNG